MATSRVTATVVAALLVNVAAPAAGPIVLQEAVEHPHAGIALAVPAGFAHQPLTALYDVMNAVVLDDKGQPMYAVTLSAFPVAEKVTADEFAEAKAGELKKNLAIRHLTPLKKVPISVAGLTGTARTMSYTFRGMKSIAAQVYFIRDLKSSSTRICYLLTVVSPAEKERQDRLLPILGAVIKSVRLVAARHPAVPGAGDLGEPVADAKLGYSLQTPKGWYAEKSPFGLEMGQVDYLVGGLPMPSVRFMVAPASGDALTAEAAAKQFLGIARRMASERKQTSKVASEGPTKLDKLTAYQFVLVQSSAKPPVPPAGERLPTSVVVVQRTARLPDRGSETPKVCVLILTCRGDDAKAAAAGMAAIAGGLSLTHATTQPATQPTSRPATQPAGKPTTKPAPKPAATKAKEK